MYKEMKKFQNKIEGVTVLSSRTEFRRYCIELSGGYEPSYIYQNSLPTIKELRDYKLRYDKENGNILKIRPVFKTFKGSL